MCADTIGPIEAQSKPNPQKTRYERLDSIDAALRDRIVELASFLTGKEPNPKLIKKKSVQFGNAGSLKVEFAGLNKGRITDFESGTGKGETPLQFIARQKNLPFPDAVPWAKDWLGWNGPAKPNEPGLNGHSAPANQAAVEEAETEDQAQRIQKVQAIAASMRPIPATPAEEYLIGRGIGVPSEGWPNTLGFIPNYQHRPSSTAGPALMMKATDNAGRITATQAVLPTAVVERRKVTHGVLTDCNATFRLPARPGSEQRTIVLAEGGVTGLSVWEPTGLQVRCMLGSLNRDPGQIPVGHRLIIARDRDHPDGRLSPAVEGCVERLVNRGLPVFIATPTAYPDLEKSDFNEVLKRDGPDAVRELINAAVPYGLQPFYPDAGMPVDEASNLLRREIGRFFESLLSWDPSDPATRPVHGIRAAAGLSKSDLVLEFLVRPEMVGLNVAYYVPEHRLSEELDARLMAKAGSNGSLALVIRGRNQFLPDGRPMCCKADLAATVAKLGPNVTETLCNNGKQRCEHYDICPYIAQMADKRPAIRFMPHAYMFLPQDGLPKPDVVIIDERFWPASLRGMDNNVHFSALRLDQLFQVPVHNGEGLDPDASIDLHRSSRPIYKLVMDDALTAAKLGEAGITAENCEFAARCHYRMTSKLKLPPGLPYAEQQQRLNAAKAPESLKVARFFRLLADEMTLGRDQFHSIRVALKEEIKGGDHVNRIYLTWSADLKLHEAPTLVIDADLDVAITRRFLPAMADSTVIDVERRGAHVTQITERAVSKTMLVDDPKAGKHERRRRANRRAETYARWPKLRHHGRNPARRRQSCAFLIKVLMNGFGTSRPSRVWSMPTLAQYAVRIDGSTSLPSLSLDGNSRM